MISPQPQGSIGNGMNEVMRNARIHRDKNFDGRFFFGVRTTGIFCRPSCPAPTAKEENVLYFSTVFEALDRGFRPCRRCRPDITTEYAATHPAGNGLVQSALDKMYEGYLQDHTTAELAQSLGVSERHLRKLFVDNLGSTPAKIERYHKALFAKKLVIHSNQPISDIAFATGFSSLRQFNEVFRKVFDTNPTTLRRDRHLPSGDDGATLLQISYRPPFDFPHLLSFLRPRAMKGVEVITEDSYARTFRTEHAQGFITVRDNPENSCLLVTIHCDDPRCYMTIHHRIRRMFDLATDFSSINAQFASDPFLSRGMISGHVPRLPVVFDPFECVIRAVLGRRISVKAATTIAGRLVKEAGRRTPEEFPNGLDYFFPVPEELLTIDLGTLGVTRASRTTLVQVAEAVLDGRLLLTGNQQPESFHRDFSSIRGIGDWTVNYVAMRGLGMMDSFPYNDLGVIKAMTVEQIPPTKKELLTIAEQWRPYRSYATLCLWNSGNKE